MPKDKAGAYFSTPLMSAFREAFVARDARKRVAETVGGERVVPGRHSTQRRGNEATMRRDLSVDLASLLNTIDLASAVDLRDLRHVANSIVNYGLRDVGSLTSQEEEVDRIKDDLKRAFLNYEPRLNPDSIQVERDETIDDVNQRLRFSVSAEMFFRPANVLIDFVAEIDVGSGKINLSRLADTP